MSYLIAALMFGGLLFGVGVLSGNAGSNYVTSTPSMGTGGMKFVGLAICAIACVVAILYSLS